MPRQTLKKRSDGRYVCKYHGKSFYGKTQGEALAARDEYKRGLEYTHEPPPERLVFADYAIKWIQTYKAGCREATFNQYATYLNRASEALPDVPMSEITPSDVQKVYNAVLKGMGEWSIKKFCMVLTACFESAFNDGIIPRNPCNKAKRPKGKAGTHRAIEPWERDLILSSVGRHPVALAAMVMLYAGLRRGEALMINLDRDIVNDEYIHVGGAVHFDVNQPVPGDTKSIAGVRDVPLFTPLRKALQGQHGLILSNASGGLMSQTSFRHAWSSYMRFLSSEAGKTVAITPHDLRHSFCTMLYDADIDIKTAVKWMGHADEKMILRVYAHLSSEKTQSAIWKVENHVENYVEN